MVDYGINNEAAKSLNSMQLLTINPSKQEMSVMAAIRTIIKDESSQGNLYICPTCNKEFRSIRKKKYCSPDCQIKFNNNKQSTDNGKALNRKMDKKRRDSLSDAMVRKAIYIEMGRKGGIKYDQITPEMIVEKRLTILAYRKKQEKTEKKWPSCKVYFNECEICRKTFTTMNKNRITCGELCRCEKNKVRNEKYKETDIYEEHKAKFRKGYRASWTPPKPFECKQCGKLHQPEFGDVHTVFCSNKCSKRYSKTAMPASARKRARHFNVEYEPVNVFKVFRRDQWHCQICGKPTPKKNRGTRYSNAPELDHRIPMSNGGPHLYSNVQCSCRACNGWKANHNELGQLPLFGIGAC